MTALNELYRARNEAHTVSLCPRIPRTRDERRCRDMQDAGIYTAEAVELLRRESAEPHISEKLRLLAEAREKLEDAEALYARWRG